jgi:hypothetical protein
MQLASPRPSGLARKQSSLALLAMTVRLIFVRGVQFSFVKMNSGVTKKSA